MYMDLLFYKDFNKHGAVKAEKHYLRGHQIEKQDEVWVFSDTKEPTVENWQDRPCGHCGRENTKEGHDGCLGTLEGVMNACCGHGQTEDAYVQFEGGYRISGKSAIEHFKVNGCKIE